MRQTSKMRQLFGKAATPVLMLPQCMPEVGVPLFQTFFDGLREHVAPVSEAAAYVDQYTTAQYVLGHVPYMSRAGFTEFERARLSQPPCVARRVQACPCSALSSFQAAFFWVRTAR